MSSHRSPRVSRQHVEQLLDGPPALTDATRPLAALLHAAAAPAHPEELVGEQAALTAFEAAQLDPVPSPRRQNVLKSTLAKILTVKAAIVLAAAAGTTGVVLASTSGALTSTDSPSEHRPADHPPAVHSSSTHTPADTPRNGDNPGKSSDAPSPSMAGLCNAYQAHKSDNPGKALDNPAFTALITAAGGKDNVDDYCDTVAASKNSGQSDDTHGKPTNPPNNPGNNNSGAGDDNPPATHPAAPPSRDHAPDNPPTGGAGSPPGAPLVPPVAGG